MLSSWEAYLPEYRAHEVQQIWNAAQAGECVAILGLSGSGKSNLLGFLNHWQTRLQPTPNQPAPEFILVDCNRLRLYTCPAFFTLIQLALAPQANATEMDVFLSVSALLQKRLETASHVCLLFDRFDVLASERLDPQERASVFGNLRALRDAYKYRLAYVIALRHPLDDENELAELFFAHTLWLGTLSETDARWSVLQYAARRGLTWGGPVIDQILKLSWSYPSLLRAICEAYAAGAALEMQSLGDHPTVRQRVDELWSDQPSEDFLRRSGLWQHPLLFANRPEKAVLTYQLTAKENLLWEYFQAHPHEVCSKDELIRAVWPEDRIYEHGIRDDSLAQLIRRLREKTEADPSIPRHIHTIPGRGYRYTPS